MATVTIYSTPGTYTYTVSGPGKLRIHAKGCGGAGGVFRAGGGGAGGYTEAIDVEGGEQLQVNLADPEDFPFDDTPTPTSAWILIDDEPDEPWISVNSGQGADLDGAGGEDWEGAYLDTAYPGGSQEGGVGGQSARVGEAGADGSSSSGADLFVDADLGATYAIHYGGGGDGPEDGQAPGGGGGQSDEGSQYGGTGRVWMVFEPTVSQSQAPRALHQFRQRR